MFRKIDADEKEGYFVFLCFPAPSWPGFIYHDENRNIFLSIPSVGGRRGKKKGGKIKYTWNRLDVENFRYRIGSIIE